METLKVRKVGNSLGIILPKDSGLQVGDLLGYTKKGEKIVLDTQNVGKEQDKKLIEQSFMDFANRKSYSEEEMRKKFGKYGWGTDV